MLPSRLRGMTRGHVALKALEMESSHNQSDWHPLQRDNDKSKCSLDGEEKRALLNSNNSTCLPAFLRLINNRLLIHLYKFKINLLFGCQRRPYSFRLRSLYGFMFVYNCLAASVSERSEANDCVLFEILLCIYMPVELVVNVTTPSPTEFDFIYTQ